MSTIKSPSATAVFAPVALLAVTKKHTITIIAVTCFIVFFQSFLICISTFLLILLLFYTKFFFPKKHISGNFKISTYV